MTSGMSSAKPVLGHFDKTASRDLILLAASQMPCGLIVYDADNRVVFMNDRSRQDLGLPDSVGPGVTFAELVGFAVRLGRLARDRADKLISERPSLIASGQPFESEEEWTDGRRVRLSHKILPGMGWLTCTEDVTETRKAESRIVHMALHDSLTGLGNRMLLRNRFDEAVRRRNLDALLYVDLDGFKGVNDDYGQAVGDRVLRAACARMQDCLRDSDFIARFGGDEFMILLSRTGRADGHESVALRILRALSKTFAIDDLDIEIGASIGSAQCRTDMLDLDEAVRRADEALFHAKAYGRGRHIAFERIENASSARFRAVR